MSNENNDLVPKNVGRPKGSQDIKPRLARTLWEGLIELSRRRQQTLPEIVAAELDKNFTGTLATFSKFLPKSVEHTGSIDSGVTIQLVQFDNETRTTLTIDPSTKLPAITKEPTKRDLKETLEKFKQKEAVKEKVPTKANPYKPEKNKEPKVKKILKQDVLPPRRTLAPSNREGARKILERLQENKQMREDALKK